MEACGSHIAGRVAGRYGIPTGSACPITGVGSLYPVAIVYLDAAEYPAINGKTAKLRIRATLETNDVAPTGNYTVGLHPITRPATSGGAGLIINTIGVAVGSTLVFTTPAADSLLTQVSSDFALPSNGYYCLGMTTTTTVANSSLVQIQAKLQTRHT